MQQATYDSVDEVGRATAEAGIDAGFHKGGEILRRTRPARRAGARGGATRSTSGSGSATATGCVDAAETAGEGPDRGGDPRRCVTDAAAVIHPGRLVRGLARHVEALGVGSTRERRSPAFRPKDATGGRRW